MEIFSQPIWSPRIYNSHPILEKDVQGCPWNCRWNIAVEIVNSSDHSLHQVFI